MRTKLGNYNHLAVGEDGGLITRANMPFLDIPVPPKYSGRSDLKDSLIKTKIELVQSKFDFDQGILSEDGREAFRQLLQPFMKTMSNIAGPVHNINNSTLFQVVKNLKLDPQRSILLECGSGAPIFGIGASFFTKETICLDLPSVMHEVYSIISWMSVKDAALATTIHLVAG